MGTSPARSRRLLVLVLAALVVIAGGIAAAIVVTRDDDEASRPEPSPSTTTAPSTSTTSPPTTAPPADELEAAIWPPAGGTTYTDPVEAARGFAVDFAGFTDPILGDFVAGDAGAGTVEVRAFPTTTATTVQVRELTAGAWSVVGAASPNIQVDEPQTGASVTSPIRLTGRALAFEGTVEVDVREDGNAEPLGTGFVTGSGSPPPGSFEGQVEFEPPARPRGAVLFRTRGGEDGRVLEVTAVRVRFAPG